MEIMRFYTVLLIIGDCLLVTLMGFYAGVGIWESGSLLHILGMTVPSVIVWLLLAYLLKVYRFNLAQSLPEFPEGTAWYKRLPKILEGLNNYQQPVKLLLVWLAGSLFAVLWQSVYWRVVLHSARAWGIRGFITWYCPCSMIFFVTWRLLWTLMMTWIILAKHHQGFRVAGIAIQAALLIYMIFSAALSLRYAPRKYTVETLPEGSPRTALVFGAGVYFNGQPSAVMTDRVLTAVDLYKAGKIDTMILSGDNSDSSRNEVDAMEQLAEENGVPESAIIRDTAGYNTNASCYNAKNVFKKDALVLVTSGYHTSRTLLTADHYGITAAAVNADRRMYNLFSWGTWIVRDFLGLPVYWLRYHIGA